MQDDGNATPRYEFGKMDILILIVFLVVLGLFSQVVGGNSRDLDAKLGA